MDAQAGSGHTALASPDPRYCGGGTGAGRNFTGLCQLHSDFTHNSRGHFCGFLDDKRNVAEEIH